MLMSYVQIRDRLPELKAIVQYTKQVTSQDPNIYEV